MSEVLAPWRSPLQKALHLNRSQVFSRYFQLATVDLQGLPTNRTVVFRGFESNTNNLLIITDSRSEKILHLQKKNQGEICWYFTKTREQFRISGGITVIFHDNYNDYLSRLREQIWQQLSDKAKEQFSWATPGKRVKDNREINLENRELKIPLDNFCLLIFQPVKLDHLQLKGNPQNRHLYFLDEQKDWQVKEINP